jgi:DNA-binding Lrp family transcriptional regulator
MAVTRIPPALNDLDRRIVAALQIDPRASWSQLSGIVGVSETTVLRRVNRMREAGLLIILGAPDPLRCGLGQPAHVYIRATPGKGAKLAAQLAARSDVRYVSLLGGAHDIMCEFIVPDRGYLSRVVLNQLPATVLGTTTALVLKQFKTSDQWSHALLGDVENGRPAPTAGRSEITVAPLDEFDTRLLAELSSDGRRSYADLSQDLGLSETAIARRIAALRAADRVYFLAMVDPSALGYELEAFLHLRVDPARLETVCNQLAGAEQLRYVAATTGVSDVTCDGVFYDTDHLYEFVTGVLARIKGVHSYNITFVLESIKREYRYPLFSAAAS